MSQPTIETSRLVLRPFRLADAASVQRLAGEREVADASAKIPHPYADGMAEEWIESHGPAFDEETQVTFALILRENEELIGACALTLDRSFNKGELGYWIGRPHWNLGYATEASEAIMAFGFDGMGLNRVFARHLARNPSSGRVMEKIGMLREGVARQDTMMWGKYEDVVSYGILRENWLDQ